MMLKKKIAVLCLICLVLAGCNGYAENPAADDTTTQETTPQETTAQGTMVGTNGDETTATEETVMDTTAPEETKVHPLLPSVSPVGGQTNQPTGDPLMFETTGKERLTYTENRNFVAYVTSAAMLSAYDMEELKGYDDAFFAEKALVLVCETVTSGSVEVEIDSIVRDGDLVSVVLSHELPGDVGTADMVTWLIWAEVDRDLAHCQWVLHNPALPSQLETQ